MSCLIDEVEDERQAKYQSLLSLPSTLALLLPLLLFMLLLLQMRIPSPGIDKAKSAEAAEVLPFKASRYRSFIREEMVHVLRLILQSTISVSVSVSATKFLNTYT